MTPQSISEELPIIEVPLELRGLSDEEIIQASESKAKEKKSKNAGFRLSKKARAEKRLEKEKLRLRAVTEEVRKERENIAPTNHKMASIPMPRISDFEIKETKLAEYKKGLRPNERQSERSSFDADRERWKKMFSPQISEEPSPLAKETLRTNIVVRSSISEAPKPTSGRVLAGSFGKSKETSKAMVISAAELEKKRALERAAKIRSKRLAEKRAAQVVAEAAAENAGETPVKRKRGRPRKDTLLVENELGAVKTENKMAESVASPFAGQSLEDFFKFPDKKQPENPFTF